MKTIKSRIFDILDKSEQNGFVEKIFDLFIIVLIIMNVIVVIIEPSIKDLHVQQLMKQFELVSIFIFSAEYILRIWVADLEHPEKGKLIVRLMFIISPIALIDLIAILPFYIPFLIPVDLRVLRILRVFRLFRILKINRYTDALSSLVKVIKAKGDQLISSLFVIIVLMIISSVIMFNVESVVQPDKFTDVFDAMWWVVATLTTVGYGDIYPISVVGKIMSAFIAILGIGIVAIPTGIIASGFTELVNQKQTCHPLGERKYCPYCGHSLENDLCEPPRHGS